MKKWISIILALLVLPLAMAQTKQKPSGKADRLPEAVTWYDGGRPRQAYIDPDLVAEFNGNSASTGERPVTRHRGLTVWDGKTQAAQQALKTGKASPMFRDSPGGALRALPGTVIVQLDQSWTSAQISSWLSGHALTQAGEMPIGKNIILIEGEAGLPALELANRLHALPEVQWAQPDWWVEYKQR